MSAAAWLLVFLASGYRPAVVIERYPTEAECRQAMESVNKATESARYGSQLPMCLRGAAR